MINIRLLGTDLQPLYVRAPGAPYRTLPAVPPIGGTVFIYTGNIEQVWDRLKVVDVHMTCGESIITVVVEVLS